MKEVITKPSRDIRCQYQGVNILTSVDISILGGLVITSFTVEEFFKTQMFPYYMFFHDKIHFLKYIFTKSPI